MSGPEDDPRYDNVHLDCAEEIHALQKERDAALAMLRRLEWCGAAKNTGYCPECLGFGTLVSRGATWSNAEAGAHRADCKLQEILK